jgi:hypothetical protein
MLATDARTPVQRQWKEFQVIEMLDTSPRDDFWPTILLLRPDKSVMFVPGSPRIGTGTGAIYVIVSDDREAGNEWPTALEVARRIGDEILRQKYRPARG